MAVVDEPNLKFADAVTSDSRGRYTLTLNRAFMRDAQYAAETIAHELTHVFDSIFQGRVYSTQPELELSVDAEGIYPSGAVAEELARLYETGPDAVRTHFAYPLDRSRYQYDAETTQGELLAQTMSIYTDNARARVDAGKRTDHLQISLRGNFPCTSRRIPKNPHRSRHLRALGRLLRPRRSK